MAYLVSRHFQRCEQLSSSSQSLVDLIMETPIELHHKSK